MKTKLALKTTLPGILIILAPYYAICQFIYIPGVPDLNQPIDPWWGLLPDNACAPVSAANICVYWDDIISHSNAVDLNSRRKADSVPGFLYYWMDTHDLECPGYSVRTSSSS